jgi:DNA (cytosine-5)-methyltransferase 1
MSSNLALGVAAQSTELALFSPPAAADGRNAYLKRLDAFTRGRLLKPRGTLISLFCGGGGLDLGLGFGGFSSVVASDLVPDFVETVVSNLPHARPLVADAFKLTGARLLKEAGTREVDLVAAGPPCQAFSILGRRGSLEDPRGLLALKYFELVAEIRPRAFIFENVPGLLTVNGGADWHHLIDHARKTTGYYIHFKRLNAVTFGVPQIRERLLVVGFRESVNFSFPSQPTGPCAEPLKNLNATPSSWALDYVDGLPNHRIREHGDRVRGRYERTPQGGRDRTDHTDRVHPDRPSGTVLVGSSAGGGRPHIHPYEPRVITVREGARLQSFPDWYVFAGSITNQYRQIGNAVPPLVAYEVGLAIGRALSPG